MRSVDLWIRAILFEEIKEHRISEISRGMCKTIGGFDLLIDCVMVLGGAIVSSLFG